MTRFVVLTTQRSGSTWVVDRLDSHESVVAYSELFLAGGEGRPRYGGAKDLPFWETWRRTGGVRGGRRRTTRRYLDLVYRPRPGDVRAVGFKLMYGQAGAVAGIRAELERREARVVHLVRRNHLDVIISKEAAVRRGLFHAREGEPVAPVRVRIDAGELVARLERRERERVAARETWRDAPAGYLEIAYEALRRDDGAWETLQDFLGVPRRPLSSTLQRLNRRSRVEMIENLEDVRRALAGTRFESLLEASCGPAGSSDPAADASGRAGAAPAPRAEGVRSP